MNVKITEPMKRNLDKESNETLLIVASFILNVFVFMIRISKPRALAQRTGTTSKPAPSVRENE